VKVKYAGCEKLLGALFFSLPLPSSLLLPSTLALYIPLLFLFSSLSSPHLLCPSFTLEVGPMKFSWGSWGRCIIGFPPGPGTEPQTKSNLVHFNLTSGGNNIRDFTENQQTDQN